MIDVVWQDEDGGELGRFEDPAAVNEALPYSSGFTRCLSFIDPYGDTTFNQLQLPVLRDELRALSALMEDGDLRSRVEALISFIAPAVGEIHTYIKFVGD